MADLLLLLLLAAAVLPRAVGTQGRLKAEDPRCCNVCPHGSVYGYGHRYCPHSSRGPIWLCPSCDKSSRACNSDVGYDTQIVTSGGGVTHQTAKEGVGQVT